MEVGVGLPGCVPGTPGELVLDWARRAEEGPFASLGVVDRVLYGNYEPMVELAAAAAVTRRVELLTSILIAPLRETVNLAKQVATVDALSGGRLVLGVAVGARRDDYEVSEAPYAGRGDRLTEQLTTLRAHLGDDRIGAAGREGGPPILVGGASGAAFARMGRLADGYIHAGGPARAFARAADQARAAWADAGRPGQPALRGMAYFAIGADAADAGREYLLDYYAFTGPFARRIADGLLTTPQAVRDLTGGYADAGCDQLTIFPAVAAPDQLDRLADALA